MARQLVAKPVLLERRCGIGNFSQAYQNPFPVLAIRHSDIDKPRTTAVNITAGTNLSTNSLKNFFYPNGCVIMLKANVPETVPDMLAADVYKDLSDDSP